MCYPGRVGRRAGRQVGVCFAPTIRHCSLPALAPVALRAATTPAAPVDGPHPCDLPENQYSYRPPPPQPHPASQPPPPAPPTFHATHPLHHSRVPSLILGSQHRTVPTPFIHPSTHPFALLLRVALSITLTLTTTGISSHSSRAITLSVSPFSSSLSSFVRVLHSLSHSFSYSYSYSSSLPSSACRKV